jgi:trimeric autotransporter adhesin
MSKPSADSRRVLWVAALSFTLFSMMSPMLAQLSPSTAVPQLISYSGVLKDAAGRAVSGTSGVTFLIYKDEAGGSPLWLETQNVKADASGHYSVQLGAASAHGLPAEIFMSRERRWLAVEIGSEPEQSRVLLVAVPYAMKGGGEATALNS